MSSMEEDHRRDYTGKRLADDAVRALEAVLASPELHHRLGKDRELLQVAQDRLRSLSDHVVAVWN